MYLIARQLNLDVAYNGGDNWAIVEIESAHFSIEDASADFDSGKVTATIKSKAATHYKYKALKGGIDENCSQEEGYSAEVAIDQAIDATIADVTYSMAICVIVKGVDGSYTPVNMFKYESWKRPISTNPEGGN